MLRMLETGHADFRQRIDMHNLASVSLRVFQRRQHARMVRTGILPDDEDRFRAIEIRERYSSLPNANRLAQRRTTRLVTHVRAIGKIVRSKLPHEKLIKKRGLVAGATRGVEDRLIRVVQ